MLALLVAEGLARWKLGAPLPERLPILEVQAHPTRGFAMVPGQEHYTYTHRTRTNSLGLRGPELDARAGLPRVLLLGDSMVYGQGVADEETLPALLEAELGARGVQVQVVNAGVRAYGTNQELALLEELGERIAAASVVVCWFWNDIDERDPAAAHARLAPLGPIAFDTKSRIEGLAWWRWQAVQVLRSSALLMWIHDRSRDKPLRLDAGGVDAAFARLERQLEAFGDWCGQREVSLTLAILPEAALAAGAEHPAGALQQRALALARAKGIAAVDLTAALRAEVERLGRLPVIPHDGHYDGRGNRALARGLAEALEGQMAALQR